MKTKKVIKRLEQIMGEAKVNSTRLEIKLDWAIDHDHDIDLAITEEELFLSDRLISSVENVLEYLKRNNDAT